MGVSTLDYRPRLYDPLLDRFTQPDTIVPEPFNPQDLNRYSYVVNNPLKYVDPTGYYQEFPPVVVHSTAPEPAPYSGTTYNDYNPTGPASMNLVSGGTTNWPSTTPISGGRAGFTSSCPRNETARASDVPVAANTGINNRVEVMTPSIGSITTTTDMLGGLQPGMTTFENPSVDHGDPVLALSVDAASTYLDGAGLIVNAYLGPREGYFAIRQLLGQPLTLDWQIGLRFASSQAWASTIILTGTGAYLIGTSINSTFPSLGAGRPGIAFYDWLHPEPLPGSLTR